MVEAHPCSSRRRATRSPTSRWNMQAPVRRNHRAEDALLLVEKNMSKRTVQFSIYRYDPDKDDAPYMQDISVELEPPTASSWTP